MKKFTTFKVICLMILSSLVTATFLYLAATPQQADAYSSLVNRLKGKILLRVEHKGEAWYVNPDNGLRIFLGSPQHAFDVMRGMGLGISDNDLFQIPLAPNNYDENPAVKTYTGHGISLNYNGNWTLHEWENGFSILPYNTQPESYGFLLEVKTQTIESFVNEYNSGVGSHIEQDLGTTDLNGTTAYLYSGTSAMGNIQMILFTNESNLYVITYGNDPEINNIINSIKVL